MDAENPGQPISREGRLSTGSATPTVTPHCEPNTAQPTWGPSFASIFILFLAFCFFAHLFSAARPVPGQLKRWSLLIYGTAEPPYAEHRQQARSAEMTAADDDLTEEDSGESLPCRCHFRHPPPHSVPVAHDAAQQALMQILQQTQFSLA